MRVRRICCLNNLGTAPYQSISSYGMKMMPPSLGNIILLKEKWGMRESIPRQVDKKSEVPKEERWVWNSQGEGKDKLFFCSLHALVLVT